MKKKFSSILSIITIVFLIYLTNYYKEDISNYLKNCTPKININDNTTSKNQNTNSDYIILNNNEPSFNEEDKTTYSFEKYSQLDYLGRAGVAYANISKDLMPTEERESIANIKPSGWHMVKYDIVPNKYLYNRCHLIAYQLTGENDNMQNLITCTKQMNSKGMIKWENKVAEYVKSTNNHVLYRVTPIYNEDNLLASGVTIEAYSVEDNGKGIKFNIYIKNEQEGIEIDYKTGESKLK